MLKPDRGYSSICDDALVTNNLSVLLASHDDNRSYGGPADLRNLQEIRSVVDESPVSCGPAATHKEKGVAMTKPKPKPKPNSDGIVIPQPKEGPKVVCAECKRGGQTGITCSNCGAVLPSGL